RRADDEDETIELHAGIAAADERQKEHEAGGEIDEEESEEHFLVESNVPWRTGALACPIVFQTERSRARRSRRDRRGRLSSTGIRREAVQSTASLARSRRKPRLRRFGISLLSTRTVTSYICPIPIATPCSSAAAASWSSC